MKISIHDENRLENPAVRMRISLGPNDEPTETAPSGGPCLSAPNYSPKDHNHEESFPQRACGSLGYGYVHASVWWSRTIE